MSSDSNIIFFAFLETVRNLFSKSDFPLAHSSLKTHPITGMPFGRSSLDKISVIFITLTKLSLVRSFA